MYSTTRYLTNCSWAIVSSVSCLTFFIQEKKWAEKKPGKILAAPIRLENGAKMWGKPDRVVRVYFFWILRILTNSSPR